MVVFLCLITQLFFFLFFFLVDDAPPPLSLRAVGVAKLPGGEEQQRSSSINLTLSIPPNAVGEVWIPADGPEAVSEGGSPATNVLGVIFLRQEGNLTVWALGSGNFFFRALSS